MSSVGAPPKEGVTWVIWAGEGGEVASEGREAECGPGNPSQESLRMVGTWHCLETWDLSGLRANWKISCARHAWKGTPGHGEGHCQWTPWRWAEDD